MAGFFTVIFAFCAMLSLSTLGAANKTYVEVIIATTATIPNLFGTGFLTMTVSWTTSGTFFPPNTATVTTLAPNTVTITVSSLTPVVSTGPTVPTNSAGLCYLNGNLLEKCHGTAKPTLQSNAVSSRMTNPLSQFATDIKLLKTRTISAIQTGVNATMSIWGSSVGFSSDMVHTTALAVKRTIPPHENPTIIKSSEAICGPDEPALICFSKVQITNQSNSAVPRMVNPFGLFTKNVKLIHNRTIDAISTIHSNILAPGENVTTQDINGTLMKSMDSIACKFCTSPPTLWSPVLIGVLALFHLTGMAYHWSMVDGEKDCRMVGYFIFIWVPTAYIVVYMEIYSFSFAPTWKECITNGCAAFLANSTPLNFFHANILPRT